MKAVPQAAIARILQRGLPFVLVLGLIVIFASASPRFLAVENLTAIVVQSSWLIVVALGVQCTLLVSGIDLSVGSMMFLSAVILGLGLRSEPPWVGLLAALGVGAVWGAINGLLIARLRVPAFIATLAMLFVGRGLGLLLSSTQVVYANAAVADFGRGGFLSVPLPLATAGITLAVVWIVLRRTPFGPYVRSIGADAESARKVGVPTVAVTFGVYVLCGALAGLGGFISFSQTASASPAFGQNAEFLAIAAAVLGGTSLSGGRGELWAPIVGALLIMTIQNGLVMVNANPYAYPVITGAVIFFAALLDSVRSRFQGRTALRGDRPDRVSASLAQTP